MSNGSNISGDANSYLRLEDMRFVFSVSAVLPKLLGVFPWSMKHLSTKCTVKNTSRDLTFNYLMAWCE